MSKTAAQAARQGVLLGVFHTADRGTWEEGRYYLRIWLTLTPHGQMTITSNLRFYVGQGGQSTSRSLRTEFVTEATARRLLAREGIRVPQSIADWSGPIGRIEYSLPGVPAILSKPFSAWTDTEKAFLRQNLPPASIVEQ